jgi:large subunit ribosomal protein L28
MFPSTALFGALSSPFKRSQLGLFHGKLKQYGNNVPFSKKKTRRTWLPNIQKKRLFSDAIGENVTLKVTMRALRTIKKVNWLALGYSGLADRQMFQYGGLDEYVLGTKPELLGWEGMRLRVAIRERREQNEKIKSVQEDNSASATDGQTH